LDGLASGAAEGKASREQLDIGPLVGIERFSDQPRGSEQGCGGLPLGGVKIVHDQEATTHGYASAPKD